MTRNLTFISTDKIFHFLGYRESIGKVRKCLLDRISNPLEKKKIYVLFMYPHPLLKFASTPRNFPDLLVVKGRGDIFWNHTILTVCSYSFVTI